MRQRFPGVQNDQEFIVLFGQFYFEAIVKIGSSFVSKWAGNRYKGALVLVNVFSFEIAFLYNIIIDFDR